MQTLTYVKLCRETTNNLKAHLALPKQKRKDDANKLRAEVDYLISTNTNPTLPSFQNMVELAKSNNLITKTVL